MGSYFLKGGDSYGLQEKRWWWKEEVNSTASTASTKKKGQRIFSSLAFLFTARLVVLG